LWAHQRTELTERATKAEVLAGRLHKKVVAYTEELGAGIRDQFRAADPQAHSSVTHATPPDERAKYWQIQIVRTAREVNIFTN
jgi:primosomal protein N''